MSNTNEPYMEKDLDSLYDDMLMILNNKETRDNVLNTLHVKLKSKSIKIVHKDMTNTQKERLREFITAGIKKKQRKTCREYHNCTNCKYWISKHEYTGQNECKYLSNKARLLLFHDYIKCKFFKQGKGDTEDERGYKETRQFLSEGDKGV